MIVDKLLASNSVLDGMDIHYVIKLHCILSHCILELDHIVLTS